MVKKCVSGCKGFTEEQCNKTVRCSYTNGEKHQYCRLSQEYKMGKKPNCNITKRLSNKENRIQSANIIKKFIKSKKQSKKQDSIESKREKSKNIIGRFMKNTSQKRRLEFLKAICSDSGVCMAFGTNRKKILDFFDNFTDFRHIVSPIRAIGKASANGFVKEIKYEKNGYVSFAVLKSSANRGADNLVYEYIVGQFINKLAHIYPCFLQTYGLYYYKSEAQWKYSRDTANITADTIQASIEPEHQIYNYGKMCEKSKHAALLIEHVKNAKSLGDFIKSQNRAIFHHFVLYNLAYVLYQVYMPLSQLKNVFNQYDLHLDNILIYEPVRDKYLEYNYHTSQGTIVKFKSPYIVKIIDYGRSYYKYDPVGNNQNPRTIYDNLCREAKCNPCGEDMGFSWLEPVLADYNYFISSSLNNPSHDLRLLFDTYDYYKNSIRLNVFTPDEQQSILPLNNMFKKLTFGVGIPDPGNKRFGTEPNNTSGLPAKINNVADAEKDLRDMILNNQFMKNINDSYYDIDDKLGDMHIYSDNRPMRFEPV
jgi:hypothetical protein